MFLEKLSEFIEFVFLNLYVNKIFLKAVLRVTFNNFHNHYKLIVLML